MQGKDKLAHLYDEVLANLTHVHGLMTQLVPLPKKDPQQGWAYRYKERSLQQAIVQKLARVVSGLSAAKLLLENGFIQEQGAMHRMLDEFQEDVNFLSYALIQGTITEDHKKYLKWFYQEEYADPNRMMETMIDRPSLPRRKIQAYLSRIEGGRTEKEIKAAKALSKSYSGFVHGASPHIMEMMYGNPPHYHLRGMIDSPLWVDHEYDIWNYFHRAICSFAIAAMALGDDEMFKSLHDYTDYFGRQSERNH